MTEAARSRAVLRDRAAPDHGKVGFVELFFDLVFVFAITQLSHGLLEHLTLEGALETGFLMLAVWAVWMWTTWAINWLDTTHAAVRLMLFAVMAAGLVMSISIPEAFGARGLPFALAYAFMHLIRNAFTIWALRAGSPAERRNFVRIHVWLTIGAALWIAGAFADGPARWAFWAGALLAELGSPWWGFWTPGLGASTTADWQVDPAHIAERCGLFVIIALGESIIMLGATFAGLHWDAAHAGAFALGFLGAVAMWWVYFVTTAEPAEHLFAAHADPGRVARAAYTYAHIPLVAGLVTVAVADELVLAHPAGHVAPAILAATLGGPALFLAGSALFRRLLCGGFPASHLVGLTVLGLAIPAAPHMSPLALAAWATGALVIVAAWETAAPPPKPANGKAATA